MAKVTIGRIQGLHRLVATAFCGVVAVALLFGGINSAQASANSGPSDVTVMVVNRLVLWESPSFNSPIVAVLYRGREFTVFGRSPAGHWLYGMTDIGTVGWLPSAGFLMLHRNVSLAMLPVFSVMGQPMMSPMATPMPTAQPSMGMGY